MTMKTGVRGQGKGIQPLAQRSAASLKRASIKNGYVKFVFVHTDQCIYLLFDCVPDRLTSPSKRYIFK